VEYIFLTLSLALANQERSKPAQTQHSNTVPSFMYFPTTRFGHCILPSSGRKHKFINGKL